MATPDTITVQSVLPYYHTVSICLSVVGSVAGAVWAILKALNRYATNHFAHLQKEVIDHADLNAKDIVNAVDKMGDKVVIAVLQAK